MLALVAALGVGGCAATVPTEAAEFAADPACAAVLAQLTGLSELNGLSRHEVTSQSTAAWGDSGDITFACGLAPLGPSTDVCQTVGEVDWVATLGEDRLLITSYGRAPAARVSLAGTQPPGVDVVLDTLSPAVSRLPENGRSCL